jgi:hypothetical protein
MTLAELDVVLSLISALRRCIENHCSNDTLFCGTCTEARKTLAKAVAVFERDATTVGR